MGRKPLLMCMTATLLAVTSLSPHAAAAGTNGDEQWVATWSAALHQPSPGPPGLTNPGFNNQTLRQIVHTSIGGARVRVRLSTFGASALVIGAAHIALRDTGAAIVPGSDRTLTFQLIARAHARGLKIYGGTLTAFGGFALSSSLKDEMRQVVNDWAGRETETMVALISPPSRSN